MKALLTSIFFLKNKTNYVMPPQENLCSFALTFRIKSTFSWHGRADSSQLGAYLCTSSSSLLTCPAAPVPCWSSSHGECPHIPEHGSPLPHLPVFPPKSFYLANGSFFRASSDVTSEMLLPQLDVAGSSSVLLHTSVSPRLLVSDYVCLLDSNGNSWGAQ